MDGSSIDLKFSKSVLIRLLDGSCLKTTLQDIVKNLYSLDKLLAELKKDDLIFIETKPFGKNIQEISLTSKGHQVAEQLKRAEEVAKGELPSEEKVFPMPPNWRDRFKGLSAMAHLNVLDDHVAIQEIDYSGKTQSVVMVYVKRVNSHFELWCEKDESRECRHVDFAWSLPQMRALIEQYIREGKIKEAERLE